MSRFSRLCVAILVTTAVIRLATLGAYPLADTTEARYGEIARLMLVTGDWITPQIEVDVPFWGKPPLSIWLTAVSFKAFGVSEFSARLPAFLLLMGTAWLVASFGKIALNPEAGLVAAVILLSSGLGFVSSGAVMTDPALLMSTTLAMMAFWRANVRRQFRWGYVFFAALGFGILAKGPIAAILILTPIGTWVIWRQQWIGLSERLPWKMGTLLTLAIALPWYLFAEQKTPGFLNYFIIGEHWSRFVTSGWAGDLYGSAHAQARGMIWLFWVGSVLPWSVIAIKYFIDRQRGQTKALITDWHRYLILWFLTPMAFFTFAGNILPAYVLPGLPAFALLLAQPIAARDSRVVHAGWLVPVVFLMLGPYVLFDRIADRSQRDLIELVQEIGNSNRLVYLFDRPYSASFYSNGNVTTANSPEQLKFLLDQPGRSFVVAKSGRLGGLPNSLTERLNVVQSYSRYILMVESEPD